MLNEIDKAVFYFINNSMHLEVCDPVMIFITDKPYLIFSAALIVIAPRCRTRLIMPFILAMVAFGISDLIGNFFKHLFERERPFLVLDNVNQLVSAHSFAFPSNHAANSFAFATGIVRFFRKTALPFLFIALMVALSRVYVGVHYPSDVIAGGLLGTACSFLVFTFYEKINGLKLVRKDPHNISSSE